MVFATEEESVLLDYLRCDVFMGDMIVGRGQKRSAMKKVPSIGFNVLKPRSNSATERSPKKLFSPRSAITLKSPKNNKSVNRNK